jgi:hypothetical protein
VDRYDTAPGLTEARRSFGGLDLPAAIAGMLAALGTAVLLAGLAGAAGSIGYQRDTDTATLSTAGLVTGMAVLLVAFLTGGWVAGRMARYDGVLNGVLSAVLFIGLAAGLSALGSWLDSKYDFFGTVHLPQWFSGPSTSTAIGSALVGILVVLVAAALGGAIGSGYHRRADRVIAVTPPAGEAVVSGDADVEMERSEHVPRHAAH